MNNKKNKGFTLIELLVVIAIIGLLSSVVLASLSVAKKRSQDATVRQGVNQLRTLMEQNYTEYKTYSDLEPQMWFKQASDCNTYFVTGKFASQASQVCKSIIKNTYTGPNGEGYLWIGTFSNTPSKSFSIMGALPSKATYYCVGSSGNNSDVDTTDPWSSAGCSGNP
ncbi:MAG: type II secretion system protein [bacterium]